MLKWDKRYYEQGLDRGVLYIPGRDPVAWNGLQSFDEGESGMTSLLYRDGVIYLADVEASDFKGSLKAIFFPDEFHECLGIPEVTDGLYVDNQKPKRFGFSYRTLIGSGSTGDLFGYQIHLVYNAMASIGSRSRNSLGGNGVAPVEFLFDIVCTPVKLAGYRPTAHFIIDTRNMSSSTIAELEALLYGDGVTPGQLPDPQALYDLMNFGDAINVTVHTDGTFTVVASNDNLYPLENYAGEFGWYFQMDNINGLDNGDGTYDISDGGTTTVILE